MSSNKAGPSKNSQMEDAEAAELARAGDADFVLEGSDEDTTDAEDPATTDAGEHTTDVGTDVGTDAAASNPTAKKQTKERKNRTPSAVANVTDTFTKVSKSGMPEEPRDRAKGYSMQLGCIVRETVSINTYDLRTPENEALRAQLLKRLHERYVFPADATRVDSMAITKMNTALTSWRFRVKKKIQEGKSWEEISAKEPFINIEDFEPFKASLESDENAKWTEWGRNMRALNLGNHHLGSGGYVGKKPIWDKEDAEVARLGLPNPWLKITDEQVRNFVRSRYYLKPGTGEFVTDYQEVRDFEATLVRNLITADISKSICVDFYMGSRLFPLSAGG